MLYVLSTFVFKKRFNYTEPSSPKCMQLNHHVQISASHCIGDDSYFHLLYPVSVEDIDSVRSGRQTEGLKKYTKEALEPRVFSILFKGRRKNLDLIASSEEEARRWVSGLEKIISNMSNLSQRCRTEQYPYSYRLL